MTQGRYIKLYLVDGTTLEGTIYEVDEERDAIIIQTETEKLVCVDNDDIMKITLRRN